MPAPIATSLRTILPSVTANLAARTGVAEGDILLLAREDTPHFHAAADLLLRVGPPQPDEGFSLGAGRHAVVLRRQLQVTPRVRLALDVSDRDDQALLGEQGLLSLEEAVVNALHIWTPEDTDGNWLTVEPLHWSPGGPPVHETPVSQSWLHTDLVFVLRYQLAVSDNGF